jgi:hypothetical protein
MLGEDDLLFCREKARKQFQWHHRNIIFSTGLKSFDRREIIRVFHATPQKHGILKDVLKYTMFCVKSQ